MHQHLRLPPVTASPANSPRTNPTRTNNPRDQEAGSTRSDIERGLPGEPGPGEATVTPGRAYDAPVEGRDNMAKLSQVVQNYHTKAALIILQSRVPLAPAYTKGTNVRRVNKWFNVELDETDALREDIRIWRNCDVISHRPPPMIIEVYLDTEELTNNQSLVIVDDHGKRWDVEESLRDSVETTGHVQKPRVVLERWRIELGDCTRDIPKDLGAILPRIYKNSIVLFRSLYTFAKLLPAWKLKKMSKPRTPHALPKIKFRICEDEQHNSSPGVDELTVPLYESRSRVSEDYSFGSIDSPAGEFTIKVSYRANCDFRIDNSEALLSSHFMGMDEDLFVPSLGRHTPIRGVPKDPEGNIRRTDVGSLPQTRRDVGGLADQGQAYGSLSTFHNIGAQVSSSPISALRAARDMTQQSPSDSPPLKAPPDHRSVQGSRSSLRSAEGAPPMGRRTSVSFMPFKSPSLSASPLQTEAVVTASPRGSVGRTSALSALAEARNPFSLTPSTAVSARGSPVLTEVPATSSASSSPRPGPTTRYSSSFGHRRARLSVGGGSRTDDDNNSSGKASVSSSTAHPGSGILPEGGGASSDSIHTDDDNISDFLKLLDQKKDLKSFRASVGTATTDASTRRTTAALNKFQRMRDSNAALSDSMSSSLLLYRSSSSSSRQLSSVPPMVAGTSMSISSSPGKPISPHTPHTPAIPSRLSANSIIEYNHRERSAGRHRLSHDEDLHVTGSVDDDTAGDGGTGAIDIPTSPRPFHPSYRRSSSVAQQHRPLPLEYEIGDVLPFGMRSASLGDGDQERQPLSLSALLGLQDGSDVAVPAVPRHERSFVPSQAADETSINMARQRSSSQEGRDDERPTSARGTLYRPRIGRGSGRGLTPPQGSSSSLVGDRGSGSGSSDQRGARYSFTRPMRDYDDEEPLLFAMSDFGAHHQSRRSIEEGRGGPNMLPSERGGESGASSRRGSKRGGHTWA
ncbi:autophagy protein 13 [Xylographa opegraphella]|nr:autophagy protein 13 [Xylographa opegraphella]